MPSSQDCRTLRTSAHNAQPKLKKRVAVTLILFLTSLCFYFGYRALCDIQKVQHVDKLHDLVASGPIQGVTVNPMTSEENASQEDASDVTSASEEVYLVI